MSEQNLGTVFAPSANRRFVPGIVTISGRRVSLANPDPKSIDLGDIAHSLSQLCRFSGHTKVPYSVAEHCVRVSWTCRPEDALWGLLHDASEAYVTDLPTPIKHLLKDYRAMEDQMQAAIAQAFELPEQIPASVHEADRRLLVTEARDLCADTWPWQDLGYEPLQRRIVPMSSQEAKQGYISRFLELTGRQSLRTERAATPMPMPVAG